MRISLLITFFLILNSVLHAQKDTVNLLNTASQKNFASEAVNVNVNIYPVPVRENNFTIKADRNITMVKITNMIGQDIYRIQYNNPQSTIKIWLDNPKRGIYLVTLMFDNGTRTVKRILVEEPE
ncbi:MAG: T9SS type A sorting domain-containing protein [Bacteroidales bacterium]|nr:T9SS type A sorting domain-containing protein [Bacteroidales bacterium]